MAGSELNAEEPLVSRLSPYGELLDGERRLLPQRQVAELDARLDIARSATC